MPQEGAIYGGKASWNPYMANGSAATSVNIRYRLKVTDKALSGLGRLSKLLLKVVVFRRDGRQSKRQSTENTDYCKQCSPRAAGQAFASKPA